MKRLLTALAVGVTALVATAAPALADSMTIREVDTRNFPEVSLSVLVTGKTPDLGSFTVRENNELLSGDQVNVIPIAKTDVPVGTALVIDTSGSMARNGAMDQAKAAAKQFVAQKQPNDRIAVVAFSTKPEVRANFTTDPALLNSAIDSLVATGETALWDAVRNAASLFSSQPTDLMPNMVVLSDGKDTVSTTTEDQARAAVLASKAVVFSIGLQGSDFEEGPIRGLAEASGGQYLATTDPKSLSVVYGDVQRLLQNQYRITYTSTANGSIDIAVTVPGAQAISRGINTGTVSRGITASPEVVENTPAAVEFLTNKWLVALLVLVAVGLLAYAVILIAIRQQSDLDRALIPYAEGGPGEDDGSSTMNLAETQFVQRAMAVTTKIARERGVLQWAEAQLERADLPLRAAEAIFFYVAAVIVLSVLGLALGGLFGFILAAVFTVLTPLAVLSFLAGRRQRQFTSQLPDTLQLLAGSLRAGYSLMQGVEAVSQEVENPMGRELRRVLIEARLGRPLEEALDDCADRMKSPDFDWAVMAIRIQREVGGNLAELLSTVAETMLARERLRREIRALTAEGRISAIVLGILPVGLGAFLWFANNDYISVLTKDGLGQTMLIGSLLMAGVGFYWMKKTIEIEV